MVAEITAEHNLAYSMGMAVIKTDSLQQTHSTLRAKHTFNF